jgi:rhamnulokinase
MSGSLKFLALDLGASSGRAVVGLLDDDKLSLTEVHRFENGPVSVGNSLYWDVLKLFSEMKQGLRKAVQAFGPDFSGAGLDTWGVDFALLGPNDVLLETPHHYRDSRTDGMVEHAEEVVSRTEIYENTGIQFMQINTLYQVLSICKSDPWMLDAAQRLLMLPSLFNFWFTGTKVDESSHVSTSQMYNPITKDWARPMLDKLGIPTRILGEIVAPATVLGNLRESISQETGAAAIPFVAPGSHDTASAVAAVPAVDRDCAYISCGTWSLVGVESDLPIINEQALNLNFTNEGGIGNTRFLRNVAGLWLAQECRRIWAQEGREFTYAQLTDMASRATPLRSIVDPDDASFIKPGDMPGKIREYCVKTGQYAPETEGEVIRTVLDSLAMKYRWVIERLDEFVGRRVKTVHMVGGGIQNQLLCQLTADATGRRVVAGPVEATAAGNILVQALGLGHIGSLEEAREIVRRSFEMVEYYPRPCGKNEEAYAKLKSHLANAKYGG